MAPSKKQEHWLCYYCSCSLGMFLWHIHSLPLPTGIQLLLCVWAGAWAVLGCLSKLLLGRDVCVWALGLQVSMPEWAGWLEALHKAGVPILTGTKSHLGSSIPCSRSSGNIVVWKNSSGIPVLFTAPKYMGHLSSKVSSYCELGRNNGYKWVAEFTLIVQLLASI